VSIEDVGGGRLGHSECGEWNGGMVDGQAVKGKEEAREVDEGKDRVQ
jgi:hypothetical protein